MHLIVCVDTRDGMSFCGKRLSSDRECNAYLSKILSGRKLWLDPYSAVLFPNENICQDIDFLQKAGAGEYCFAEVTPLDDILEAESVTLIHWNRAYPSTLKFPRALIAGMRLVHTEDFLGNSHEKITVERYVL